MLEVSCRGCDRSISIVSPEVFKVEAPNLVLKLKRPTGVDQDLRASRDKRSKEISEIILSLGREKSKLVIQDQANV